PARSREQQASDADGDIRNELRKLEHSRHARIGAFAIDTADNTTIGHRKDERFPLCSTFKLLAAAAILHKNSQSDLDLLHKVVHYGESDLVEHSPVTENHVGDGMLL